MYLGKSAGTITFNINTGEVLMVKEQNPGNKKVYWTFPKGHIENGESPKDAAYRETLEETGVKVKILKKLYEDEIYRKSRNTRFHKDIILYLAITTQRSVKPQYEEVLDAKFVPVHSVLYELKQNYVEFIKPFLTGFFIISKLYPTLYTIK